MDTTCWHMNATLGGANLHPGVNLHPGANCAYEHGYSSLPGAGCSKITKSLVNVSLKF